MQGFAEGGLTTVTITEKVAYIRGLAEGLELDPSQKEVKVLNAIIDLLDEMANTVSDVESDLQEVFRSAG